jgi:hypothetical protein
VPNRVTGASVAQYDAGRDHSFGFGWAGVGGIALVALAVVVYSLTVTWGGFNPGVSTPGAPISPISAHYRELAGLFLTGFLIVLIARALSTRTAAPVRIV